MLNKVLLTGNLGADAELRVSQNGENVLKFRLATNEKFFNKKTNSKEERTEWSSCTVFGERAAKLAQYLTKGKQVFVEGSLRTTSYEKDGQKRYATEIIVNNLEFLGGGKSEGNSAPPATGGGGDAADDGYPSTWG